MLYDILSDPCLQQVHNFGARIPDVRRPVLRRCLDIHDPVLKHALVIGTLLQLIHNPEPDLILVRGLLVSLLQHVILGEALLFKRRDKTLKVFERMKPELLLPLAWVCRRLLPGGRVGCDGGEVALEVGVEFQHWQAEDRLYLRLDIANLRFVVLLDAVLGIKVQCRTTIGVGRHAGVVDSGGELGAHGINVGAKVFITEDETKHAAADLAARVADFGIRGLLEGHGVGRGKSIEFGFSIGAELFDVV